MASVYIQLQETGMASGGLILGVDFFNDTFSASEVFLFGFCEMTLAKEWNVRQLCAQMA